MDNGQIRLWVDNSTACFSKLLMYPKRVRFKRHVVPVSTALWAGVSVILCVYALLTTLAEQAASSHHYSRRSKPGDLDGGDDDFWRSETIGHRRQIKSTVHKLLFLGYHRSGSSIASEILDMDPRVMSFYEPLDAFYVHKTGYYGRKAQRVILYANETDFRPMEPWEPTAMAAYLKDMLTCNLRHLPTEFLGHRNTRHASAMDPYRRCCVDNIEHQNRKFNRDLDMCREIIRDMCGFSVETALQNGCYDLMASLHMLIKHPSTLNQNDKESIIRQFLHQKGYDDVFVEERMPVLLAYRSCIGKIHDVIGTCEEKAEEICRSKPIRIAKLVRFSFPLIKYIVRAIPDLQIIFIVRDPRAVAFSRSNPQEKAYSRENTERLENEIYRNLRRICATYRRDWAHKEDIERRFPDVIKTIKYEDFVQSPTKEVKTMYGHFRENIIDQHKLDSFIERHMFASNNDGKIWGTVRSNATDHAYRWRHSVSPELTGRMEKHCADVIKKLNYELFHTK